MGDERLKGVGKQVSGSLKEAVGKVTGDTKAEAGVGQHADPRLTGLSYR